MSNTGVGDTKDNYNDKAKKNDNEMQRQQKPTFELLCFNNWIKSVLINIYTKQMCHTLETILDVRRGQKHPLLHVLDIGCGRGQDIKKWKLSRVKYMMAADFSQDSIKTYEQRWRSMYEPFHLQTACADFCSHNFYNSIGHTYYDIVSAQLCFHYMFKTKENLQIGLTSILSNLLVGGVFIATIPDSYSIVKKVKEKGFKDGGYEYFSNSYCSIRFASTEFSEPFGNEYGFYLQDAVGEKNKQTGQITYINEYLIELESLDKLLSSHGVKIQYTDNFLQFYKKHKDQYRDLLCKIFEKANYQEGDSIKEELWQIAHLYRVLVCRKVSVGKSMNEFNLNERIKTIQNKEIKRRTYNNPHHGQNYRNNHYNNNRGRNHHSYDNRGKYHK